MKHLALGVLASLFLTGAILAAKRPNVVFLVSEDNSVHYLRHYGAEFGAMPNIEKLAADKRRLASTAAWRHPRRLTFLPEESETPVLAVRTGDTP